MIDNHLLGQISESCNDSLLILPVDIHEIILIPSRKNRTSIADWKAVIHALNIENKGVKLSDLVYLFDRADKNLDKNKRKEGKQMKLEARWDNAGRDQLTIGEMVEMGKDGYEFVISGGHIVSVLINL